jgi:hypothetical protein
MPLSRHLYSLDEVQAALFYTGGRGVPVEALFWTKELILSGCASEAISILFQCWLWTCGTGRAEWLLNAWRTLALDELSEEAILLSSWQLASISSSDRDTSLMNILVLTSQKPAAMPDTITRKQPPGITTCNEKEFYFVCAVYQGKARAAWWISQYIHYSRVWELLEQLCSIKGIDKYANCIAALQGYEQLLGYKSDAYDKITLAACILILSTNGVNSFKSLPNAINAEGQIMLTEFQAAEGRRGGRLYTIPKECLYGTTIRGRSKWTKNNLTQLYNSQLHLVGCPFWDEALSEYADVDGENIHWKSDEKLEKFYEKYFPDDIPDEWSKRDQHKSHGDGILGPKDKPNILKYSRLYLLRQPRAAWNTNSVVYKYLETMNIPDCSLERIVEFGPYGELSVGMLEKLKPVHKIKIT